MSDIKEKGNRAKTLLNDEMFKEAVDVVDEALIHAWRDAQCPDERDQIWQRQRALADIVRTLEIYVESGALEEAYERGDL
jgi:hypothetical protein